MINWAHEGRFMEYFESLGSRVSERWKAVNYNEEKFTDIATEALREAPPQAHVSLWDILKWALLSSHLPFQNVEDRFGDPPLTVYSGRKFRIDVLFWLQGMPAIHQHSFSGAFHVLHGASVHTLWDFEPRERLELRLVIGNVRLQSAEILVKGDVRPIYAGRRMFHSTYHLDRPSVSLVLRTIDEEDARPQYSLLPPTIAFAQSAELATVKRQCQLLRMLLTCGRHDEFDELFGHALCVQDAYSIFEFLRATFSMLDDDERRQTLLQIARIRHPVLVEAMGPMLNQQVVGDRILDIRRRVTNHDLRFFLALLRNVPDRALLLKLVGQRHPSADPAAVVVRWMRMLCESGVLADPCPVEWMSTLHGMLLQGAANHGEGSLRVREPMPAAAPQYEDLALHLKAWWLLQPLLTDAPRSPLLSSFDAQHIRHAAF